MLRYNLTDCALEEEGRFLVLGVQLAVGKNSSVEVLLCIVAEDFVFFHDARVHIADQSEVGFRGVPVSVDFVGHQGSAWALREELLDHHEMRPAHIRALFLTTFCVRALTRQPWQTWGNSRYWRCTNPWPAAPVWKRNDVGYARLWYRCRKSQD